jgi:hypothetical protein
MRRITPTHQDLRGTWGRLAGIGGKKFGEAGMECIRIRFLNLPEKGVLGKPAGGGGHDGNFIGQGAESKARLVFDPGGQDQGASGEEVVGGGSAMGEGSEGIGPFARAAKNQEIDVERFEGGAQFVDSLAGQRGGGKEEMMTRVR